jgi:hypothetical protein
MVCFSCGGTGHKAEKCPNKSKVSAVDEKLMRVEKREDEKRGEESVVLEVVDKGPEPSSQKPVLKEHETKTFVIAVKEGQEATNANLVQFTVDEKRSPEEITATTSLKETKLDELRKEIADELQRGHRTGRSVNSPLPEKFLEGINLGTFLRKHKKAFKEKKKQLKKIKCTFCKKKGHWKKICPNFTPTSDKFLRSIMRTEAERKEETWGARDAKMLLEGLKQEGERRNNENKWKDSTTDQYANRLRRRIGYWSAMGASNNVLSWLYEGIKPKFTEVPERKIFKNTPSYYKHIGFVHKEVMKHLKEGSFEIIEESEAKVINPIHVVEGKKLRMCVDSRYTNLFNPEITFKNETAKVAAENLVDQDEFMISIDLEKAYYLCTAQRRDATLLLFLPSGFRH